MRAATSGWQLLLEWVGDDPTFALYNPGWWSAIRLRKVQSGKVVMWRLEGEAYTNVDPFTGTKERV